MTVNVIFEVASFEQLCLEEVITVGVSNNSLGQINEGHVRSELTRVHKNCTEYVRPHSPC